MRISSLLLSLLVSTAAFLSSTPTQALALNLRSHAKSSAVGVLAAASVVQVQQQQQQQKENEEKPEKGNDDVNGFVDGVKGAQDKTKDLLKNYHELPEGARYAMGVGGIVFGLFVALFGYQFIRTTIFVVSAFTVGSLVYGVLEGSLVAETENRVAIVYASSAAAGLLAGLFFLYFSKLAFFLIGASLGIMIAIVLEPIALKSIWPEQPVINLYLWMGILGLATGMIASCFPKPITVISTSVVGSFIFILSIGAFTGGLEVLSTLKPSDPVPDQFYLYFTAFIFASIIAMSVQFCYTANSESDKKHKEFKTK